MKDEYGMTQKSNVADVSSLQIRRKGAFSIEESEQ